MKRISSVMAGVCALAGQLVLNPASAMQSQPAAAQAPVAARGGIGIIFTATPAGGVIAAVAPGSPAERAGLKAGQTIRTINGTSVVGFDMTALSRTMHVDTPTITLGIVGVGDIKIVRSVR